MSRIFLSHSSADNAAAIALRDWLVAEGWDDLFLDLDPARGIGAGERWERALNAAALRCEAVVFLVSTAWLKSAWCLKEFHLAAKLNKRMFGVLIEDIAIKDVPVELTATWQLVDLAKGADHAMFRAVLPDGGEKHVTLSKSGLQRLKTGLTKAGLDARFFAWPPAHDPERPPYRGLRPLEAEDAGIFFGREAPIIETLDRLRGLREGTPPRFLAILGASGAGKSSFLRAGLLPRLARDDRNFLVLPVMRPERAVLTGETGLLRSLEQACAAHDIKQARAEIKAAITSGAEGVSSMLVALTQKATPASYQDGRALRPPAVILPIDQSEELFQAEGAEEAQSFLGLLRDMMLADRPEVIVIVTIRSDAYERLQTAPQLDGVRQHTLSLPPIPKGAYQTIIEAPALRLHDTRRALKIEPGLTAALLADIETGGAKDALPLLAFAMERLYLEYGGGGHLKLAGYSAMGGIAGSIEAAVVQALKAADNDPAVPKDGAARLALMRRAFIPWLAGIDLDSGAPRRSIARLSDIPEEARPLVKHLIDQRLLSVDRPTGGEPTIEPAHEALLRQWGLLQGWLEEDFAQLATLEGVKRATRDWLANDKVDDWLSHSAGRLEDAEALKLRGDLAAKLDAAEQEYLAACRATEMARKDRDLEEARRLAEAQIEIAEGQRRIASRTRWGLLVASALAVIAVGLALYGFVKANEALNQTKIAQQERQIASRNEGIALSSLSRVALSENSPGGALKLALAAWPRTMDVDRPALRRVVESLTKALPAYHPHLQLEGQVGFISVRFSPDGTRLATTSLTGTVKVWDAKTSVALATLVGHTESVWTVEFSPDGKYLVTASEDKTARIWNAMTGEMLAALEGHGDFVTSASFSRDGLRVVTASRDGTARVWDAKTGAVSTILRGHWSAVRAARFSPDGRRVLTASDDGTARLWTLEGDKRVVILIAHIGGLSSAEFSPDGQRVVATAGVTAKVWDSSTGEELIVLKGHDAAVLSAHFSRDGEHIVTASQDKTARVWDSRTGMLMAVLRGHTGVVSSAVFAPKGDQVVTGSEDATTRIWESETGTELHSFKGHRSSVYAAEFSPDGEDVATVSRSEAIIWTVRKWSALAVLASNDSVSTAVFAPDNERIVTGSEDKTARVWEARTGRELAVMRGHEGAVLSAEVSSDGERVVTVSADGTGRIWSIRTGAQLAVLTDHEGKIFLAKFSPEGERVLTVSKSQTTGIWDGKKGAELTVLRGHEGEITSASFSPDGNRVATGSMDKTVRIWDAKTGKVLLELKGNEEGVRLVEFSPNGQHVLTVSGDREVKIWEAATGSQLVVLQWPAWATPSVASANFSLDGRSIVASTFYGPVYTWDAATGRVLAVLNELGAARAAKSSFDGKRVMGVSYDGMMRVWDALTGAELATLGARGSNIAALSISPDGKKVVAIDMNDPASVWDLSSLEEGDAFAIACLRLGSDTDLSDVRELYGLGEMVPICGKNLPLPVDLMNLQ